MYHRAVYFDVPPKRHQDFIDAALEDGRESLANEPGTKRFEVIQDRTNPNRYYLNEAYDDEAAFEVHACGPYFKRFFHIVDKFAIQGPDVIDGSLIEDAHSS